MPEETITAAPDLSAVESALVAIESHISEAESVRASEREQSISVSLSVSESYSSFESSSLSESLSVLADEQAYYKSSTETLIVMTIFLAVALGVVCGLLSVIANKR